MDYDTPFACVTTDSGLVSEILHVSPLFMRCGPRRRGQYADRRESRTERTDARQHRAPAHRARRAADFSRYLEIAAS
jgi:hypothetical protein